MQRRTVRMPDCFVADINKIYEERETKTKTERLGYDIKNRTLIIDGKDNKKKKRYDRKRYYANIRRKLNASSA